LTRKLGDSRDGLDVSENKKHLALAGFEPWIVQPVAQYAIPTQQAQRNPIKNKCKQEQADFTANFNKYEIHATSHNIGYKLLSKRHDQKLGLVLRIAFAEFHTDTPLHTA
jgi:hypothetical protein